MRRARSIRVAAVLLLTSLCSRFHAQALPTPVPVPGAENLQRLEGVDAGSGVHYLRFMLTLPVDPPQTTAPPRFTIECSESKGKRTMQWFVSFGGVESYAFEPPFHATQTDLFPPQYPAANLKMVFEGYMKSKPFTRSWAVLPTGELRYRNPGMSSPNMESVRHFFDFLFALPGLHIGDAKPVNGHEREVIFQTKPLVDEVRKAALCGP